MDAPAWEAPLRAHPDGGVVVEAGRILAVGGFDPIRERYAEAKVADHSGSWVLPGFVDTHVHLPQLKVLGALGRTLLDWLSKDALPEELRWADTAYARAGSRQFLKRLLRNGTTSCLAFGAHQASAMEIFFEEAAASQLRVTSGLVLADTVLPEGLLTTPERAYRESLDLIRSWHGKGKLRYAVTPRFTVSATSELLATCGRLLSVADDLYFTTHLNEMKDEIDAVLQANPAADDYLETYEVHGLVNSRSLFAHNVHPTDSELARLSAAGASVCHCPGSNLFLGSGLFPLSRHVGHGVRVALGTDVGAGPGYSLLGEALHAHMHQMLLQDGLRPTPAQLLHLATRAGALALGLEEVGVFEPGLLFDAVVITPPAGSTLEARLASASSADEALAALITLAREDAVSHVFVEGEQLLAHGAATARG